MDCEQEWSVGRILGTSSAYWRSSTLHAAVKLGIFSVLGEKCLTAAELGEKIGAVERGLGMLLNGLTAMGLLEHGAEGYKNTGFSRSPLVKGEAGYIGHIILHHYHLVDAWVQLDEAVVHGEPVEKKFYGEEVERESFLMGMFNLAMAIAPSIVTCLTSVEDREHMPSISAWRIPASERLSSTGIRRSPSPKRLRLDSALPIASILSQGISIKIRFPAPMTWCGSLRYCTPILPSNAGPL
jgi:hypothetical protein